DVSASIWILVKMALRLLGLLASCILLVNQWGPEVSVAASSVESLRHIPNLGGNCARSAVVAIVPQLGQKQIPVPSPTRADSIDRRVTLGPWWPSERCGNQ
ncbi:hypothetical protein NDU88_004586, partial [Pleurodeles waltl]